MRLKELHSCKFWPLSLYADNEVVRVTIIESPVCLIVLIHKPNHHDHVKLFMDRGVIWIGGEQAV